jgi:hypothetical protein
MSVFTVVIIIWGIYQLIVSVTKKQGTQQTPGKPADPFKLPDGRFIGDAIQGISNGTWKEQLKQALEKASNPAGPLQPTNPKNFEEITDYYVETEGAEEIERTQGIQGIEGTSNYVEIPRSDAYRRIEEAPREEMAKNSSGLNGGSLSLTERDLAQGIMWSVILGKPRAMGPFRGPRT